MDIIAAVPTASTRDAVSMLKALADPGRLLLARLLLEGTLNVTELTEVLDARQSTVSRHLRILLDAGLLQDRREGRLVFYGWGNELPLAAAQLKGWVATNAGPLPEATRRRLALAWERRRERSVAFFATVDAADPAAAWLGSPDCLPSLVDAVPRDATVADVGTGTGRVLPSLRERTRTVIGIDASREMLDEARGRLAALGIEDVDLRLGDMAHLPLDSGEVDALLMNMALHHAAEPRAVLREAHRVLSPGGLLLLGDFLPHNEEWMREKLADQWLGFAPADITHWLEAAGFVDVELTPMNPDLPGALSVFVARAVRRDSATVQVLTPQPRSGA